MSISLPPSVLSLPPSVTDGSGASLPAPDPSDKNLSDLEMGGGSSDGAGNGFDEAVELPEAVDLPDADDAGNGFDEAVDLPDDSDDEQLQLASLADDSGVPTPEIARLLTTRQDIAEFYSPPRVLPVARQRGLSGSLSLDILTGWDFKVPSFRALSLTLLLQLQILLLVLSPPCTIFSELQRLWNFKRMARAKVEEKWAEGMLYLTHAMDCALQQHQHGRFFIFEHPARATSWNQDVVKRVMQLPGVFTVLVDQCMLGLRSKVHGVPMRKRTRLMTNSHFLASRFANYKCDSCHAHQAIQGAEGGVSRSAWAQIYPRPLVDALVLGALDITRV